MIVKTNEMVVRDFLERAFNQGDLSAVDEYNTADGIDHQEPPGTDIIAHLKQIVTGMRTAFPDLHFEINELLAEGDTVALRVTMTGTQNGPLRFLPGQNLPPTGRCVNVPHMYFVHMVNGKTTDMWHVWNTPLMMQQLGIAPVSRPMAAQEVH